MRRIGLGGEAEGRCLRPLRGRGQHPGCDSAASHRLPHLAGSLAWQRHHNHQAELKSVPASWLESVFHF